MASHQSPNPPISNLQSPVSGLRSPVSNLRWELFILLLAALVRFWRLDYHSFWFDEAVSLDWAAADVSYLWPTLLDFTQDKHPPLYYVLLHFWMQGLGWVGLGQSDVALRTLGALIGVVLVLGVIRLCLWSTKRNVALLTGLLVALSPLLVWYSQELRMFQLAAAAIVWSAYYLVRAWYGESTCQRIGDWLCMVIALEVALYSYLFSAFILPAVGVTLLGLLLVQRRLREFIEGVLALAGAGLLFLPLAINAWRVGGAEGVPGRPFEEFASTLWRLLHTFTIWRVDWPQPVVLALLLCFALLFVVGVIGILRKQADESEVGSSDGSAGDSSQTEGDETEEEIGEPPYRWDHDNDDPLRFLPLIWLFVPLLVGGILQSKDRTIFAEDRYFLYLAPFALWVIAEGVAWIWVVWNRRGGHVPSEFDLPIESLERHLPSKTNVSDPRTSGELTNRLQELPQSYAFTGIRGFAVAAVLAASLPTLWTPAMQRENWRAAAHYIAETQEATPTLKAAVVAHVDYTHQPLEWYLRQQFSADELPLFFPFGGTLTPDQTENVIAPPLQGIVDLGMDTLWLTQSHLEGVDDERLVEGWLNQNFALVSEQFPTGIKLSGYALRSHYQQLPSLPNATQLKAELVPGLMLAACEIINPRLRATDDALHPPSGWVHVRLWWQATAPIKGDLIASVQMVGAEGVWGDRLYRGNEALRRWPTSTWQPGPFVRDEIDVNLNPITPAGNYAIVVGVRDSADQPVGSTVECGKVRIES